jgi:hypothetical protein
MRLVKMGVGADVDGTCCLVCLPVRISPCHQHGAMASGCQGSCYVLGIVTAYEPGTASCRVTPLPPRLGRAYEGCGAPVPFCPKSYPWGQPNRGNPRPVIANACLSAIRIVALLQEYSNENCPAHWNESLLSIPWE